MTQEHVRTVFYKVLTTLTEWTDYFHHTHIVVKIERL